MDQQESVAGPAGHSLLTAFPLKCGGMGRGPMERRASGSEGWAPASAQTVEQGSIGLYPSG